MFYLILLFVFVLLAIDHRNRKKNKYIEKHKGKLDNDSKYEDYLKWCLSVGEIPMDKKDYIKEVEEKERVINNMFR